MVIVEKMCGLFRKRLGWKIRLMQIKAGKNSPQGQLFPVFIDSSRFRNTTFCQTFFAEM